MKDKPTFWPTFALGCSELIAKIDLPETIKGPPNCILQIDDVSIPRVFYTVETDVNDKLYFRLQLAHGSSINDYILILESQNDTGPQFENQIVDK